MQIEKQTKREYIPLIEITIARYQTGVELTWESGLRIDVKHCYLDQHSKTEIFSVGKKNTDDYPVSTRFETAVEKRDIEAILKECFPDSTKSPLVSVDKNKLGARVVSVRRYVNGDDLVDWNE